MNQKQYPQRWTGRWADQQTFDSVYSTIPAAYQCYRDIIKDQKYEDPRSLIRSGFKVYGQVDEDGIIQEIFRRIGIKNHTFIEIGCGYGLENNTRYLLKQGWSGIWIDGNQENINYINGNFLNSIGTRLEAKCCYINKDNVNSVIWPSSVIDDREIDFLSVDIDGNDYHVLSVIDQVNPRVIVVEYNAKFPPPFDWVMPYNSDHIFQGDDHFSASLTAYTRLMKSKKYSLVGCGIGGSNAYFVRDDFVDEETFLAPFTDEFHYEPARYFLIFGFINELPGWNMAGWRAGPERPEPVAID